MFVRSWCWSICRLFASNRWCIRAIQVPMARRGKTRRFVWIGWTGDELDLPKQFGESRLLQFAWLKSTRLSAPSATCKIEAEASIVSEEWHLCFMVAWYHCQLDSQAPVAVAVSKLSSTKQKQIRFGPISSDDNRIGWLIDGLFVSRLINGANLSESKLKRPCKGNCENGSKHTTIPQTKRKHSRTETISTMLNRNHILPLTYWHRTESVPYCYRTVL